jgi:hypothetical protein
MKKILFYLIFIMMPLVINAQESSCESVATSMKISDLPKTITNNIAKDYAGYTIKEAISIKSGDNVTYEVAVVKETTLTTLTYDQDGKFLRKTTRKVVPKPAPKKK